MSFFTLFKIRLKNIFYTNTLKTKTSILNFDYINIFKNYKKLFLVAAKSPNNSNRLKNHTKRYQYKSSNYNNQSFKRPITPKIKRHYCTNSIQKHKYNTVESIQEYINMRERYRINS